MHIFWIFWYWYDFQIKKYLNQKIFGKPIQKQRLNFRVNSRNLPTKNTSTCWNAVFLTFLFFLFLCDIKYVINSDLQIKRSYLKENMLQIISKKIKSLIKQGQWSLWKWKKAWIYVSLISLNVKFFDRNKQQAYYRQQI